MMFSSNWGSSRQGKWKTLDNIMHDRNTPASPVLNMQFLASNKHCHDLVIVIIQFGHSLGWNQLEQISYKLNHNRTSGKILEFFVDTFLSHLAFPYWSRDDAPNAVLTIERRTTFIASWLLNSLFNSRFFENKKFLFLHRTFYFQLRRQQFSALSNLV